MKQAEFLSIVNNRYATDSFTRRILYTFDLKILPLERMDLLLATSCLCFEFVSFVLAGLFPAQPNPPPPPPQPLSGMESFL